MHKTDAIRLLGGTVSSTTSAIGITSSAISQWPDDLPPRIAARVLAVLARKHLAPELIGEEAAPPVAPDTPTIPNAVDAA